MVSSPLSADLFDQFEKALMPGPLHQAHQKYEKDCNQCHKRFKKTGQDDLCVACHDHENIKKDLADNTGLHGRWPIMKGKQCQDCHQEHKGRESQLVLFDEHTFDHQYTDFQLRGQHRQAPCAQCHKKNQPYRKAKHECFDCHQKQDVHEKRLGRVCHTCHSENQWRKVVFDHKQTKFKLEGKHAGVGCQDCHPQNLYRATPKSCYACHPLDDKHEGVFGDKCEKCHQVSGWENTKFDHDKQTDFKLRYVHKNLFCSQCHKKNPYKEKHKGHCIECHQNTDVHKAQYGKKCHDCHGEKKWSDYKFDHEKTDFKLTGKHEKVICNRCHVGHLYNNPASVECVACHQHKDIHKSRHGSQCDECHDTKSWSSEVAFDHGLTKFPLVGAHEGLTCEECHTNKQYSSVKTVCRTCHEKDDAHKKTLTLSCERCHNVQDWKAWRFNHNQQTDFSLRGKHKNIACDLCHKTKAINEIDLSGQCFHCHRGDDTHDGQFGRLCQRCHNEKGFDELNLGRESVAPELFE